MNSFGWLLGGTTAPIFIGYFATHIGLGNSISISAFGYLLAAALLISSFFLIRANLSSIAETSPAPL
jgi:hypothetical protein